METGKVLDVLPFRFILVLEVISVWSLMRNIMRNSRELEMDANELVRALLSIDSTRRLSILDSCNVKGARLLIAGFDPLEVVEVCDGRARITYRENDRVQFIETDALDLLDQRLIQYKTKSDPDAYFPSSACIATFSYELVHQFERLRSSSALIDRTEPDAVFAFYDALVVHDYEQRKTRIVGGHGKERINQTENALRCALIKPSIEDGAHTSAISNMTCDDYLAAVTRIKEHISAGDIYQANLTQRFRCALSDEIGPEEVFLRLRRDNPAPFAAFIRRREDDVISISPENFLRVDVTRDARQIEARPIKGTRPRGTNESEDARLRAELLASDKDRAENVMIVDLLRNDLGRVCRYGSVEVADLCSIEEHPTLFHLVSSVRGTLRDEVSAGDLMRACFPCGSITGAPKIRAMEIIDEVETVPRGISMGAIGYFGYDGAIDLNVAIRTMTVRNRVAQFNVGGGIVADSDPNEEYEESLLKAQALFRALRVKD